MARVLITPVYRTDSIVLAINRFSIDRVYLLSSTETDDKQQAAIKTIKEHYEKIIEIKEKKVPVYEIVSVAHAVTDMIDMVPNGDEIYLNVSTGRRTQSFGVLFAGYQRSTKIKKIIYVTEEKNEIITIPILSFDLTDSQQKVLERIEDSTQIAKLADETKLSPAMVYRAIKELKDKGFIEETENGHKLTDAGKIARL
ncbi:MAG: CRISPR-associated CARF protein Csa3 [Candidatus Micrarchaeota archaeon]